MWGYNNKGLHPLHTLAAETVATDAEDASLCPHVTLKFWEKMVSLTEREWGGIDVRVRGGRPYNHTPLMMLAKSNKFGLSAQEYKALLALLVFKESTNLRCVDNRQMNCLMHAASVSPAFVHFFVEHGDCLHREGRFNWNAVNIDKRTVLNPSRMRGPSGVHDGCLRA